MGFRIFCCVRQASESCESILPASDEHRSSRIGFRHLCLFRADPWPVSCVNPRRERSEHGFNSTTTFATLAALRLGRRHQGHTIDQPVPRRG